MMLKFIKRHPKVSSRLTKVQAVGYPLIGEYADNSKKVLHELGIDEGNEEDREHDDDSDCEVGDEDVEIQAGTVVDEDIEMP